MYPKKVTWQMAESILCPGTYNVYVPGHLTSDDARHLSLPQAREALKERRARRVKYFIYGPNQDCQ